MTKTVAGRCGKCGADKSQLVKAGQSPVEVEHSASPKNVKAMSDMHNQPDELDEIIYKIYEDARQAIRDYKNRIEPKPKARTRLEARTALKRLLVRERLDELAKLMGYLPYEDQDGTIVIPRQVISNRIMELDAALGSTETEGQKGTK